jgi:hypothetical protein
MNARRTVSTPDNALLFARSTSTNPANADPVSGRALILVLRIALDAPGAPEVDVEVAQFLAGDHGVETGGISSDNAFLGPGDDADLSDYDSVEHQRGRAPIRPIETATGRHSAPLVDAGFLSAVRRRTAVTVRLPAIRRVVAVALIIAALAVIAASPSPRPRVPSATSTSTASTPLPRSPDGAGVGSDRPVPCGTPAERADIARQAQGFLLAAMACP